MELTYRIGALLVAISLFGFISDSDEVSKTLVMTPVKTIVVTAKYYESLGKQKVPRGLKMSHDNRITAAQGYRLAKVKLPNGKYQVFLGPEAKLKPLYKVSITAPPQWLVDRAFVHFDCFCPTSNDPEANCKFNGRWCVGTCTNCVVTWTLGPSNLIKFVN